MAKSEIDGEKLVQMVKEFVEELPTAKARATALRFLSSDCVHVMTRRGVCGLCGLSPSEGEKPNGKNTTTIAK